jgi:monoterpene epsilon-lactone hydrolase
LTNSTASAALREHFTAMATRVAENPDMGLPAMREMFDSLSRRQAEPTGVTYEEITVGGRPALWVRPAEADPRRIVLYAHGGGYIAHDMSTSRKLVGHLAKAAGAMALVPDYRVAPEHPYPAAIDDAIAAYRYLLSGGYEPARISFAGESAGGNLAAATIVTARELGLPLPAAYVGFSPWFDLLGERPSFDSGTDAFLLRPVSQLMAGLYLGDEDPHQPRANPLLADLIGFPDSYVTAGADESLVDAVTAFAEKARAAGVDTTLEIAEGMQHAFQWMAGRAPEADESITRVGEWIASRTKG